MSICPKNKTSRGRRDKRRANWKMSATSLVKCPKCGDGDIILRKSKRGRVFYGCSNFPDCDFVEWNKPTGQVCPECGSHMVEKVTKKESKSICSNKDCITNKKEKKAKTK